MQVLSLIQIQRPMTEQTGQMIWRLPGMEEPLLHLRMTDDEPWKPYTDCPEHMVPDKEDMSLGYPTFVSLLKRKWQLVQA